MDLHATLQHTVVLVLRRSADLLFVSSKALFHVKDSATSGQLVFSYLSQGYYINK